MKKRTKLLLLGACTLIAIVAAMMLQPVPQDLSYHSFADQRTIWGIPNFFNVVSNIPFLVVGIYGVVILMKSAAPKQLNGIYLIIFIGIFLTGIGSAYYHYSPNNNTLVFDRLPMTLVFMAFLSATITGWIDFTIGNRLLLPLLLLGTTSVIWWHFTELAGKGDLRFYGFIQFYPMLIVPLIFLLFASPENNKGLLLLVWVIAWYGLAKIFEIFDKNIYAATGFVSGHSLKHIAAAVASWYIVQFFESKYVLKNKTTSVF